eukprot:10499177-Alexandrium_andersonii.AAC.1
MASWADRSGDRPCAVVASVVSSGGGRPSSGGSPLPPWPGVSCSGVRVSWGPSVAPPSPPPLARCAGVGSFPPAGWVPLPLPFARLR